MSTGTGRHWLCTANTKVLCCCNQWTGFYQQSVCVCCQNQNSNLSLVNSGQMLLPTSRWSSTIGACRGHSTSVLATQRVSINVDDRALPNLEAKVLLKWCRCKKVVRGIFCFLLVWSWQDWVESPDVRVSAYQRLRPENQTVLVDIYHLPSAPKVRESDWNSDGPGLNYGSISCLSFHNLYSLVNTKAERCMPHAAWGIHLSALVFVRLLRWTDANWSGSF